MVLACQNISKAYGITEILNNINFHIEEKEKLALVGINGAGKSTLLKIIMNEEEADEGQVIIGKDITVGYLAQHQNAFYDKTIFEELLGVKQNIIDLQEQIRSLEQEMKHLQGRELENALERYTRMNHTFEQLDGYAFKSQITGILKGLGFEESDFNRPVSELSGGQKTRVSLGRLLLSRPDVILLDEPTNHLDLNSISWLENYLNNYDGAVIIVSHDRYFLDKIVTKIVELENTKSTVYHGNYSYYATKREEVRLSKYRAYMNQQAEIKHQEEVITKLKQFNREKSIKRAESREKLLEKIKRGERVAIIGNNGTGKTTILKIINRLLPKDSGKIILGAQVYVGYYDQEHQVLHPDKTIFDELHDTYPNMTNTKIRNVLAAFLFTREDVFKEIKDLSGGERGRVSLAKLMLSNANFLILDEPTNHLDITSKEILENALKNYTGTILYVSHDRYFINQTATRILDLHQGNITSYIGNYDYYIEQQLVSTSRAEEKALISKEETANKKDWKRSKEEQAKERKRQNDIKKTEKQIEELEHLLSYLEDEISLPENAVNAVKLTEISEKQEAANKELEQLYEIWESLSE